MPSYNDISRVRSLFKEYDYGEDTVEIKVDGNRSGSNGYSIDQVEGCDVATLVSELIRHNPSAKIVFTCVHDIVHGIDPDEDIRSSSRYFSEHVNKQTFKVDGQELICSPLIYIQVNHKFNRAELLGVRNRISKLVSSAKNIQVKYSDDEDSLVIGFDCDSNYCEKLVDSERSGKLLELVLNYLFDKSSYKSDKYGIDVFLDFPPVNKRLNFSERLMKCFSKLDRYTQTYEVSVSLDLSKHPEMNPKHHPADECLPESLVNDLKSIGVNCNKSGFTDDKSGYTILEFDIERSPKDRYDEITKFVTNKLTGYGFDKNRIGINKWD